MQNERFKEERYALPYFGFGIYRFDRSDSDC